MPNFPHMSVSSTTNKVNNLKSIQNMGFDFFIHPLENKIIKYKKKTTLDNTKI